MDRLSNYEGSGMISSQHILLKAQECGSFESGQKYQFVVLEGVKKSVFLMANLLSSQQPIRVSPLSLTERSAEKEGHQVLRSDLD